MREVLRVADREDLEDVAVLVVTELVTNALLHAATPVEVTVTVGDDGMLLEIADGSSHLPAEREYSTLSGTGRGLGLVHHLAHRWGAELTPTGKVVWAEIRDGQEAVLAVNGLDGLVDVTGPEEREKLDEGYDRDLVKLTSGSADAGASLDPVADAVLADVEVVLRQVPLLMHSAWHEYAEALLREYLLAHLDTGSATDATTSAHAEKVTGAFAVHARAGEAIAALRAQLPNLELPFVPRDLDTILDAAAVQELFARVIEPAATLEEAVLHLPAAVVDSFRALDEVMDAALRMADNNELLAAPTPPELRVLRRWLCGQVAAQSRGAEPVPWSAPSYGRAPDVTGHDRRGPSRIDRSTGALIAADEDHRITSASALALDLLGYPSNDQLVGQRLLRLIPDRFHQAHLAGFTLHLAMGRRALVDRTVAVPFLCADGTERLLNMSLQAVSNADGRRTFIATLTP